MPLILFLICFLALPPAAAASDWADATPTAWHQLARAESLLSAPEPPSPVAVCVVDSGVNLTPDLAPVVIERLAYDGGDPGDTYPQEGIDDGHGTYVATFLAGQVNGWGGAGLWPRAKIVSVRVFPPGGVRATAAAYMRGLRYCRQRQDVLVINLSLGGVHGSAEDLAELENRITDLRRDHNINVVAAAGNRGGEVEIPARYAAAFAVGAADPHGSLCKISARGSSLDLIAPGCSIDGMDQSGNAARFDGTSFAAPMVSATLAALRAYAGLSAGAAEAAVLSSVREGSEGMLLDAAAALEQHELRWAVPSGDSPESSISPEQVPINSEFIDYPRPVVRARMDRARRYLLVRVSTRPPQASVQIRTRGRFSEFRRNAFRVNISRRFRSVSCRFISDDGVSKWNRVAVRR